MGKHWLHYLLLILLFIILLVTKGFWITLVTVGYLAILFLWLVSGRLLGVRLIPSVTCFVGLHVGLSFCPFSTAVPVLYGIGILLVAFALIRQRVMREHAGFFYQRFLSFRPSDIAVIFLFSVYIIYYGISKPDGFYSVDILHHFYEVSWGNSYADKVIGAPDLSFFLKPAKFHFLGTRMAVLLSEVWGVSLVQAASYFVVLFYFPILIMTAMEIMHAIGVSVPLLVLFMFPLFGLKSNFVFPTMSVLLGAELLMISVWSYIRKRWVLFFLVSSALLFAKASFFIVLMGALCLIFFKKRTGRFALGLAALFGVFFVGFKLFFAGAHEHILWLHFPGSLLWLVYHKKWDLLVYIGCFVPVLAAYFFSLSKDSKRLLPVALGLSGLFGVIAIVEITSGDHLQFLKGAGLPAVMALWAAPIPFFEERSETKKSVLYGLVIVYALVFSLWPIHSFALKKPLVSQDSIDAYTALGSMIERREIVLYGKHYEVDLNNCKDPEIARVAWFARSGFERSALSGAQMLDESVKWKGVVMERALPLRIAQTLFFYQSYVRLSPQSQLRMAQFHAPWFGTTEPLPMSKHSGREAWLIQHFGFHREWYYDNQMDVLNHHIRVLLDGSDSDLRTGEAFLKFYHIRYIVLEDGDQPTPELLAISTHVFQSKTVQIFRVNDEVLHD